MLKRLLILNNMFNVIIIIFINFSFNIDPTVRHSWFSILIGGCFTQISLYAVNQTQIQRFLTMKDYKTAVTALWCSLPLVLVISLIIPSIATGFPFKSTIVLQF